MMNNITQNKGRTAGGVFLTKRIRGLIILIFLMSTTLSCTTINSIKSLFTKEPVIYFPMQSEDGSGIMNCSGKWVVDPVSHEEYIITNPMVDGLAPIVVNSDSSYETYINSKGEIPFDEEYERAMPFSEGLAAVMVDGKWGFINTKGAMVIETQYLSQQIGSFHNGIANVVTEVQEGQDFPKEWIFINTKGEEVLGPYGSAQSFSDGYAAVRGVETDDDWNAGFIDTEGDYVLKFSTNDNFVPAGMYSDGLFPIKDLNLQIEEGKCAIGYMDKNGEWVIDPEFCSVGVFSNGLAPATKSEDPMGIREFGYIDTTGKMVVRQKFVSASYFSGGCARVVWDEFNSFGLIDTNGDFIYEYEHSN